ncbi:hypothetical protein IW150_001503, partial [Coemansia sp. RSA 2607]
MMATDDTCMAEAEGAGSFSRDDEMQQQEQQLNLQLQRQKQIAHRTKIAKEILETERSYVDGLEVIEKLYIAPLLHSAILTRKEVRQVFANFADIITLSRELLAQLEGRLGSSARPAWDGSSGRVGDIFQRMAPFLKMYSLYVRNFRSALGDISAWLSTKPQFARFIEAAGARGESRGLGFQSYMLLPVQRIPRYRLLLEQLLQHTAEDHVDRASIAGALAAIGDVAAFVDAHVSEHEMTLSMLAIQRALGVREPLVAPGRRLVKTGELTKVCRKSHQRRAFYLFSDMLLYARQAAGAGTGDETAAGASAGHRRVGLDECKVMDVPDAGDGRNQFTVISRDKSFIVYADTAGEKRAWVEALAQAIAAQRSARSTLQMDGSLQRRLARARRTTMQHFPRVAADFDAPVWAPDGSAAQCFICFRAFSLFVRRHHCRACGRIVCNACSRKSIVFVARQSAEAREGRGCDQCVARLFGREALESPPGTLTRVLGRARCSLDAGALAQSL